MPKSKFNLIIFWSLLFCLVIALSWKNHLIFTDEVLFAEASYQMNQTHDYLTPQLEGRIWLEKPPLYFWFTSILYRFIGMSPLTTRAGVLLSALGCIFLTYLLGKNIFGKQSAFWASFILASSPLFLFFTKTANLDIPVTFFILAAIYAYLKSKKQPNWLFVSAALLGLGFLTRSFLSLTPVGLVAIDQLLFTQKKHSLPIIILALLLFFVIALPWNLIELYFHPQEYLTDHLSFNLKDHLLLPTPGHEPLGLFDFLTNIFFRFNPLALFALYPLVKITMPRFNKKLTLNEPSKPLNQSHIQFLYLWIGVALLPLCLSSTRHEWYALQIFPPISLLSGFGLYQLRESFHHQLTNPLHWEIANIYLASTLLAIPVSVFTSIYHQADVAEILEKFILATPADAPLYNLEHQFIPQSTHYNPRAAPVIAFEHLRVIKKPIYIYLADEDQWQQAQTVLKDCCNFEILIEYKSSKVALIKERNP
jgi:4-amino-4-deoxy-L-arabinose transferase-like glycosyltransferase